MAAPSLILDFDGTLTLVDVGDALCARFAHPSWHDIDMQYARGELSLPEAQRRMWALFAASEDDARAFALEVGVLRPGLDALLDRAQQLGYALRLASGGFEFYIRAILGPERISRFASIHANGSRFAGTSMEPLFAEGLACERCAVCKGRVVERAGPGAVYVGDGHSDTCAIGKAAHLFAVRGKRLHLAAGERGVAVSPFEDLAEVAALLPPPR